MNLKHKITIASLAIISAAAMTAYGVWAHPDFLETRISMEKKSQISSGDPVVINFSRPPMLRSYDGKVKITPETGVRTTWQDSGKQLVIAPEALWTPGTEYSIDLGTGKSRYFLENDPARFSFVTEDYPEVKSFYPAPGASKVMLDIEDPISVEFERSARNFFLKFDIEPETEIAFQNDPEKIRFELLPKEPVKEGQKYEVRISARHILDKSEHYEEIYSSSFETLPSAPQVWAKDFSVRIEQAKTYTRAKIKEGKYIDINLSAQMLSIFENGKLLDSFLISSGKRGMETPRGTHAIYNKFPRAWSKKYGLFMPYWMAITSSGSYGIHELPEWPGGYKEGANHLGIPVSHGCVRLGVGPAGRVYDWAEVGTPVVVY